MPHAAKSCRVVPCSCQRYLDPDSICCVVVDEAHHSGKEHPFFRIAKSPYVVPNDETAAVMAARSRKETEKGAGSRSRNTNNRLGGEGATLGYKRGYTHRRGYTGHNQQAQAVAAASRADSTPRTAADFPKVRGPPT